MTERKKLPHAPILEALIDLRVEPRPDLEPQDLKALHEVLGTDAFPEATKQSAFTAAVQFEEDSPPVSVSAKDVGYLFRGADQPHAVQAQREGFAFSQLPPYVDWEELATQAKLRWGQYLKAARPKRVTRMAVRYINRIELPLPLVDFREWIPKFPDIPAPLPQAIAEMVLRMVVPVPSKEATAIVTLALEPWSEGKTHAGVIFDIDVFRVASVPTEGDDVWNALESLREIKNDFFFEYLTPKTLELFQ